MKVRLVTLTFLLLGLAAPILAPAETEIPETWFLQWFCSKDAYGNGDDPDGDGLSNEEEYLIDPINMNPANWDTDNDGMDDGWELYYQYTGPTPFVGLNPIVSNNWLLDIDGEGLSTYQEYCGVDGVPRMRLKSSSLVCTNNPITFTNTYMIVGMEGGDEDDLNPLNIDTDGDWLLDSFEAAWYNPGNGINPIVGVPSGSNDLAVAQSDPDLDGLSNYREQCLAHIFRQGGSHERLWLGETYVHIKDDGSSELLIDYPYNPYYSFVTRGEVTVRVIAMPVAPLNFGLNMSQTIPQQLAGLRAAAIGWTKPGPYSGYVGTSESVRGHDTDSDFLPDGWEVEFGLDPRDASAANGPFGDPDGDGILNVEEYLGQDGNRSTTWPYINGTGDETNPFRHNWRPDSTYTWRWLSDNLPYSQMADPRDGLQLSRSETLGSTLPTVSIGNSSGRDTDDNGIDDIAEITGVPSSSPVFSCDPFIQRSVLIRQASGITIPVVESYPEVPNTMRAGSRRDLLRRDWTIECMVKLDGGDLTGNIVNYITAFGDSSRPVYVLALSNNVPILRSSNVGGTMYEVRGNPLPTNTWIHLAGSWDHANNSLNLYVGGSLAVRKAVYGDCVSTWMFPATNTLRLAESAGSFVNRLSLDEVRIWGIARPQSAIDEYSRKLLPQNAGDDVWISGDGSDKFYRFKDTVLFNGGSLFDGEPGVFLSNVYFRLGNYWVDNGDGRYNQANDKLIKHVFGTLREGDVGAAAGNVKYNDKDKSGGFTQPSLLMYYRFDDGGSSFEDFSRKAVSSLAKVSYENYRFGDYAYALATNAVSVIVTGAAPVFGAVTYGADDSDGDGLADAWEVVHALDPYDDGTVGESVAGARDGPNGAKGDPDGDGLNNLYEYWSRTNPRSRDSDGNGITDDQEDFDGDTVVNLTEQTLSSRPDLIDTDDDSLSDPDEVSALTDPASAEDPPVSRCMLLGGAAADYLEIPHSQKYQFTSWTIEAMIYPTNPTVPAIILERVVQQLGGGTNAINYVLGLTTNAAGNLQAYAGYVRASGAAYIATGGIIPLNDWTHLAVTYNNLTATLMIYTNGGVALSNNTFSAAPPLNGLGGEVFVRAGQSFAGRLDEVRLWNVARPASLILTNWNKTVEPASSNLISYFRFDDGQAVTNHFPFGPFHQPRGPQDYTERTDWNNNWAHAGIFHGNVAFETIQQTPVTIPPTLKVNLTPAAAVNLGAAWSLNGSPWIASGAILEASPGTNTLTFKTVDGMITPTSPYYRVLTNATYTELTFAYKYGGKLTVNLEPADARAKGAAWRINGGAWNIGGSTVSQIPEGTYLVEYSAVAGYEAPASEMVAIADEQEISLVRIYVEKPDELTLEAWMAKYGVASAEEDDDLDGISNGKEYGIDSRMNPIHWDTDGDGMDDYWEALYMLGESSPIASLSPYTFDDPAFDHDGDGISAWQEYCGVDGYPRMVTGAIEGSIVKGKSYGAKDDLNPLNVDTDNDLLIDSFEAAWYDSTNNINPHVAEGNDEATMPIARADQDNDGLSNFREQCLHSSFHEGLPNGRIWAWVQQGRWPFSYLFYTPAISDDTIYIRLMTFEGGQKINLNLNGLRTIPDQRPQLRAAANGWTKPTTGTSHLYVDEPVIAAHDTDGDMLPDGWEVEFGLNPRSSDGINGSYGDPDNDGIVNLEEYLGQDGYRSITLPYINGTGDETNPNRHNWRPDSTYPWRWLSENIPYNQLGDTRDGSQLNRVETLGAALPTLSLGSCPGADSDDDGISDIAEIAGTPSSSPVFSCDPFIQRSVLITNAAGIKIPVLEQVAATSNSPAGTRPDLQRRDWTIECMVKLADTNLSGRLFNFVTALGGVSRIVYSLELSNNVPILKSSNVGGTLYQVSANPIPTNEWFHLAGSWDHANNSLNLFVNGLLAVRRSVYGDCISTWMYPATNDLRLAASPDGSFVNKLYLDEVRIWGIARNDASISEYSRKLVPQNAGDDVWLTGDGKHNYYRFKDSILHNGGSLFDGEPGVKLDKVFSYQGNYWLDNGDGVYRAADDVIIRNDWGSLRDGQVGEAVEAALYNDKDKSGGFTPQSLLLYYRFDDGGTTCEDFARKAKNSLKGVSSENYAFGDSGYATTNTAISLIVTGAAPVFGATTYGADDSDSDGMPDAWEIINHLDPFDDGTVGESASGVKDGPSGAKGDPDGDRLINIYEYWSRTNPREKDTNGNGISDDQEDFDGDTIVNIVEQTLSSRPDLIDTDDDGYPDPKDIEMGASPANADDPPKSMCLELNGSPSDYVAIPAADDQRLSDWTIEAYVYPSAVQNGIILRRAIQQLANGSDALNYVLGLETNGAGGLTAYAGYIMADGRSFIQRGGTIPLNQWTHLAAAYSSLDATLRIYTNGTIAATNSTFSASPPLNGLGGRVFVRAGEGFAGRLSELRLWKTRRTSTLIAENWDKKIVPFSTEAADLVNYFRFDDGQATNSAQYPIGPLHQPAGAQDYLHPFDWNSNWAFAARLMGNVAFTQPGALVPPLHIYFYLDTADPLTSNLWEAVSTQGAWRVVGDSDESWRPSGQYTLLELRKTYAIEFRDVDLWSSPASLILIVSNEMPRAFTNLYAYSGAVQEGAYTVSGDIINQSIWRNVYPPPGDGSLLGQFRVGIWSYGSDPLGRPMTNQTRLSRMNLASLPESVNYGIGPLPPLAQYGSYKIRAWIDGDNDGECDLGEPASEIKSLGYLDLPSGIAGLNMTITDDTDNDSLPDWYEIYSFGNLLQAADGDYDKDGLTNSEEYNIPRITTNILWLSAGKFDSDGDGMDDKWEYDNLANGHGLNPSILDAWLDLDGDGLYNLQEYLGADGVGRLIQDSAQPNGVAKDAPASEDALKALDIDSDGDGLIDSFEFAWYNPNINVDPNSAEGASLSADSDLDGVGVYREQCLLVSLAQGGGNDIWSFGTNSLPVADPFGLRAFAAPISFVGASGRVTVASIRAALQTGAWTDPGHFDTDGDLLPDGWELQHNLNPRNAAGANGYWGDPDGDGLINYQEYVGQDERRSDTKPFINGTGDETNPNQMNWSPVSTGPGLGVARQAVSNDYWNSNATYPPSATLGAARPTVSLGVQNGTDTDDDGLADSVEMQQEYYNGGTLGSSPVHSMSPFVRRAARISSAAGMRIPDPEGAANGYSPLLHAANWTVECYVKCLSNSLTGYLINNPGPFSALQITYRLELSNNVPSVTFDTIAGQRYTVTGPELPTNRWVYLAGVWDSSRNSLGLFVDGGFVQEQRIYEGALSGFLFGSVTNIVLGQSANGSFANALLMDEIRIWTKALTAEEIEAGRRILIPQTNAQLKAYYRFDDGGASAENFSAKSKNTALGAATTDYHYGDFGYALTGGFDWSTNDYAPVYGADWRGADDSDGDAMPDDWEVINHLDPFSADGINGANGDPDNDTLINIYEYWAGTNPWREDTDQNGILDISEDRDGDSVVNGIEQQLGSRPDLIDTDDDGLDDNEERNAGTNPADPVSPAVNRALRLGGANSDYLLAPATTRQRLLAWTIEAWVRPASYAGGYGYVLRRSVQSLPGGAHAHNYMLGLEPNGAGGLRAFAGYTLLDGSNVTLAAGSIVTGAWTHLAATYDNATATLALMVNGQRLALTNGLHLAPPINGRGGDTFLRMGENFQGDLDDIRLWSVARTSNQIFSAMSSAIDGSTTGLVHYFRMDDGQAVTNRFPFGPYHNPYGAQDFTFTRDWNRQWRNAAFPFGNVSFFDNSGDAPVILPPTAQVNISPAAAIAAGAKWSLNNGGWQDSGLILTAIAGSNTFRFLEIPGWLSPADFSIALSNNAAFVTNVVYGQGGAVMVSLAPPSAIAAGGAWRVGGGAWQLSGAVVSNLAPGTALVEFKPLTGFIEPASTNVVIQNSITTTLIGRYIEPTAALTVTILPTNAVTDGARWSIASNQWYSSMTTNVPPGNYTVEFNSVDTWSKPASVSFTLTNGEARTVVGRYFKYRTIGSFGSGVGQLNNPIGVAADGAGNLYVADTMNNRVQVYRSDNTWAVLGTSPLLASPMGVALDGNGGLLVVDSGHYRLLRLDLASGTWAHLLGPNGSPTFTDPVDVEANAVGQIFLADRSPGRVWRRDAAGVWSQIIDPGSAPGNLQEPWGLAINGQGSLFVSDHYVTSTTKIWRVQSFSQSGAYESPVLVQTNSAEVFVSGLTVYDDTHLYGAIPNSNNVVYVNLPAGAPEMTLNQGALLQPMDVATGAGWLYISDSGNHRIVALELPQSNGGNDPHGSSTNGVMPSILLLLLMQ